MKSFIQPLTVRLRKVNWMLLLFLILVLNVKMVIKIAAVIILLILNRNMFREKSTYRQRFIWFYWSMIIIALISLLLNISSISTNHFISIAVGSLFWLICIAAAILSYWFILKTDSNKLHTTISFFFILNSIVTIGQLLFIMWDAGSFNPFIYQGMYQKYFISTGDFLTGISFDVSNTNALINAFGLVYFLTCNRMKFALLSMITLLITASNLTNILVVAALLFLFIFQSTPIQKGIIIICFLLLLVFMVKISPQNNRYVTDAYKKIFYKNGPVEDRNTIYAAKPQDATNITETHNALIDLSSIPLKKNLIVSKTNIHSPFFQRRKEITPAQRRLFAFEKRASSSFESSQQQIIQTNLPGKVIAFQQTFYYLKDNPEKIFFGCGIGSFSSKLAFRTTGLGIAGGYPQQFIYVNKDFLSNHLNLYLAYFSRDMELHSIINSPDSAYDQLIGEYGLAGVFSFIIFYIGFFAKHVRRLTYGIPLLLVMVGAFIAGYWFEQLSIVILFELLMLLNIKETKQQYE